MHKLYKIRILTVATFLCLTASVDSKAATLYIANIFEPTFADGRIETVRTNGTNRTILRSVGGGLRGLDVNQGSNMLYWSDVDTDRIEKISLDNPAGVSTDVITLGLSFPQSIGLSISAQNLFWADAILENVMMSDLEGNNQNLVFNATTTSIAVDDLNQKIYSEDRFDAARGAIVRSNFDGSSFETVIDDVPTATSIAIDPVHGYIFWTSSAGLSGGNGGVYRVNLDGTDFTELFVMGSNLDTSGLAVDVSNGYVYWGQRTADNRSDIYRMKLDGSSAETVSTGYGNISEMVLIPDMPVVIDVKPGNAKNTLNPNLQGKIWVAILSSISTSFDPLQVDSSTVRFGPNEAIAIRNKASDINKDGLGDLLLQFNVSEAGIGCNETDVTLTAITFAGKGITGTDSISTVGCN